MFSVNALDVSNTFFREATIPARGEGRSAMVCAGGPVPPREGPTAKKDEKPDKRGQLGERINSFPRAELKLAPLRNGDFVSVSFPVLVSLRCLNVPVPVVESAVQSPHCIRLTHFPAIAVVCSGHGHSHPLLAVVTPVQLGGLSAVCSLPPILAPAYWCQKVAY